MSQLPASRSLSFSSAQASKPEAVWLAGTHQRAQALASIGTIFHLRARSPHQCVTGHADFA